MKKYFSDEIGVSYIEQSMQWASASILLLVHNNKISLVSESFVDLLWRRSNKSKVHWQQ
jgi:hypothetical protein